jgi:hypothetical protein
MRPRRLLQQALNTTGAVMSMQVDRDLKVQTGLHVSVVPSL